MPFTMLKEKRNAGIKAASYIEDGMVVGLGTGSTTKHAIEALASRINNENIEVIGIPTSKDTERTASDLGIPLSTLEEYGEIEITIDGADRVDPELNLIKGGGGALLREKFVAKHSKKMIIVVDPSKMVDKLGVHFQLPVEIIPFWHGATIRMVESLSCSANLRMHNSGIFKTDNGNYIADCMFDGIDNPKELSIQLNAIPTVVENGLFIDMADKVIIGEEDGVREINSSI